MADPAGLANLFDRALDYQKGGNLEQSIECLEAILRIDSGNPLAKKLLEEAQQARAQQEPDPELELSIRSAVFVSLCVPVSRLVDADLNSAEAFLLSRLVGGKRPLQSLLKSGGGDASETLRMIQNLRGQGILAVSS